MGRRDNPIGKEIDKAKGSSNEKSSWWKEAEEKVGSRFVFTLSKHA